MFWARTLLTAFLAGAAPALAQPAAQAGQVDPAVHDEEEAASVVRTGPLAQQRVTIPVQIGDHGPWHFIIDTGSQRTVVSRTVVDRLSLQPGQTVTVLSMAGRAQVDSVELPPIAFGAGAISDIQAPVLDEEHLGAPGLLGLDGLQSKRLLMDFRSGRMTISPSRKRINSDPDAIVVEARRRNGQLILLNSQVEGMSVNIILDTGTDFSVGNMALFEKLTKRGRAPTLFPATLTSVTGDPLTGLVGRIRLMRMGGVTLRDLPVLFADARPFKELKLDDKPALLLGISALRVFDRVAIDFGRGRVDFLLPDEGARRDVQLVALPDAPDPS